MAERLAETVDIETPELVVVSYTLAGVGSRIAAGLIDLFVCAALLIAVIMLAVLVGSPVSPEEIGRGTNSSTAWASAVVVFMQFAILWGYYLFCEGLFDGRTLGKRILGLRAVRDGGYSVGFAASAVRNLMRIVDLQPVFTYLVGIAGIAISKSGKRLGDVVAGTIVVREAMVKQPISRPPPEAGADTEPAPATALLSDAEYQLLDRWAARRGDLDSERRAALTRQVGARLHNVIGDVEPRELSGTLSRLLASERRARQRGVASRGAMGASRERYAIVTTRSPRWFAFAAQLSTAQRRGLRSFNETQVREFVEEYRALSVDLARLRTATRGSSSDDLFYLGRLVTGAHNLLYRDRRNTFREITRFIAIDVPAEVRRSVVPIALGAAFLFGPAAIAWTAVMRNPDVASTFIPTSMLDRAEDGVERAKHQAGYIPDPEVFRPLMASQDHRQQRAGDVRRLCVRHHRRTRHPVDARPQRRLAGRRDGPLSVQGNSEADRRFRRAARSPRALGDMHRRRRRLSHRRGDARPRRSHPRARARRERPPRNAAHRRLDAVSRGRRLARGYGVADSQLAFLGQDGGVGNYTGAHGPLSQRRRPMAPPRAASRSGTARD